MEQITTLTREEEVEAFMYIFHCGRFDAEELVAINRGESLGDLQPVGSIQSPSPG